MGQKGSLLSPISCAPLSAATARSPFSAATTCARISAATTNSPLSAAAAAAASSLAVFAEQNSNARTTGSHAFKSATRLSRPIRPARLDTGGTNRFLEGRLFKAMIRVQNSREGYVQASLRSADSGASTGRRRREQRITDQCLSAHVRMHLVAAPPARSPLQVQPCTETHWRGASPSVAGTNVGIAAVRALGLTQPGSRTSRALSSSLCPGGLWHSLGQAAEAGLRWEGPSGFTPGRGLHYSQIVCGRKNGAAGRDQQRPKDWSQKHKYRPRKKHVKGQELGGYKGPSQLEDMPGEGEGQALAAVLPGHRSERDSEPQVVSGIDLTRLRHSEALGQVMSREANFVRVVVTRCWEEDAGATPAAASNGTTAGLLDAPQVPGRMGGGACGHEHGGESGASHGQAPAREGALAGSAGGASGGQEGTTPLRGGAAGAAGAGGPEGAEVGVPRRGVEVLCVVRALLKKIQKRVLVGDRVVLSSVDWTSLRGSVHDVLPRSSEIRDPPIANVDHLLLLFSLSAPVPEEANVSRFLVAAEATGVPFSLVFNKADLASQEEQEAWRQLVRGWGYDPLFLSVEQGLGVEAVRERLRGRVSVVAGPSGVGKSSLINALRSSSPAPSPAALLMQHQQQQQQPPPEQQQQPPPEQQQEQQQHQQQHQQQQQPPQLLESRGKGGGALERALASREPSHSALLASPPHALTLSAVYCGAAVEEAARPETAMEGLPATIVATAESPRGSEAAHNESLRWEVQETPREVQGTPRREPTPDEAKTLPNARSEETAGGAWDVQEALDWGITREGVLEGMAREGMEGATEQQRDRAATAGGGRGPSRSEDLAPVRVGEVSQRSGRGKHTTRHVSLLRLPAASSARPSGSGGGGGLLADSPGFNQPSLFDVSLQELPLLFPEVRQRLEASEQRCAFVDCCHVAEPGCVVGTDWPRFLHYLSLREEIGVREEQELKMMGTKKENNTRLKAKGSGEMYAEPKLEPKKHRRESRKRAKQAMADELGALDEELEELSLDFK